MIPLSILVSLYTLLISPPALAQTTFLWDQLTPGKNLSWVTCYTTFQCARLEVPLDYANESSGTADLAVIRLPANVSKAEYRGPILFNPGGPGASGVDTLVSTGASFQVVFGSEYDIVSFDPRGVSYSTPVASFFQTDAERALWNAGSLPTSLNASADALPHDWARGSVLGQLAAQRDTSGILKYMTTDNVARDMLLITQKFGFEKTELYLDRWKSRYGSVLGATFAALFPDKVERILIDANLTIEATDTDKVLQTFFDSCVAAGPDLCAFYEPTASAIADRLTALTNSIRKQPVPVVTPTAYGIVDYSALRSVLFTSLYVPYILWGPVAQGLAALEAGDGSILFSITQTTPPFQCDCSNNSIPFHLNNAEAVVAIQCGDGVRVTDTLDELREFYDNAARTSQFVEFLVGSGRVDCAGWEVYREGRFLGPVAAANTSFPLLLLTTSAALKTLAGFPGSALLTQDSPGTVCAADIPIFGQTGGATANSTRKRNNADLTQEEEAVLAALQVIGDAVRPVINKKWGNQ
ncbi:hypothetical protein B0H16DRAFT_1572092 [Mycena metata]|uniref:AB hydrolase-1 domain-containing protein n=1 Tax=Mycena metata TaxID=1033252 RepID=A0AAD7I8Q9_9AGAR|nr:hypothetical protein B0H16DRAFT_1572092 [Mycena metata]